MSVLWVAIPFTLFPLAQQHVSSAVTGMLNGGLPIVAAIIATLMLRRLPGRVQIVGLILGAAGVAAIALSAAGEGSSQAIGVAMLLAAVLCYGVAINIATPLQQRYGSLPAMAWMLAYASIWTAPFGLASVSGSSFAWGPFAAVLALGVVGTGLAFVFMGRLVGRVGSTRASFATYLIPVVALILGVAIRDDDVAAIGLIGIVMVLTGAFLASRADRARPSRRRLDDLQRGDHLRVVRAEDLVGRARADALEGELTGRPRRHVHVEVDAGHGERVGRLARVHEGERVAPRRPRRTPVCTRSRSSSHRWWPSARRRRPRRRPRRNRRGHPRAGLRSPGSARFARRGGYRTASTEGGRLRCRGRAMSEAAPITPLTPVAQPAEAARIVMRTASVDAVGLEERAASLATRSIKREAKLWGLDLAIRCMDLTTLEGTDTVGKIVAMCAKAIHPDPLDASIPRSPPCASTRTWSRRRSRRSAGRR